MIDCSSENSVIKAPCTLCYIAISCSAYYLIWKDSRKDMFSWAVGWWIYSVKSASFYLIENISICALGICKCVCTGLLSIHREMSATEGDSVIVFNTVWY